MSEKQELNKTWGVVTRLTKLVTETVLNPRVLVLRVSVEDTHEFEERVTEGFLGDENKGQHLVRGLRAVFPTFHGITTLWHAKETGLSFISDLSREELIEVVKSQQEVIKALYEHRQRL